MTASEETNRDWRCSRFGRAARTYHENTPVQSAMAERLADLLSDSFRPGSMLELGCGTGHLTRTLAKKFPDAAILATDLSEAMLEQARTDGGNPSRVSWRRLDARAPNLPGKVFDLVASNALVQWLPALENHFQSCRKLLSPGGILAIAGLCDDNFPELERILSSPPFAYPPGPGHAVRTAQEAATRSGFLCESMVGEDWEVPYPSATAFLAHLRDSGANRPPPPGKTLGRAGLRELLGRLDREAAFEDGIRITWKPWFLVARAI